MPAAATTPEAAEDAGVEPPPFDAVTCTRIRVPTSPAESVYELPVAPETSVHPLPLLSQRRHWYVKVSGGRSGPTAEVAVEDLAGLRHASDCRRHDARRRDRRTDASEPVVPGVGDQDVAAGVSSASLGMFSWLAVAATAFAVVAGDAGAGDRADHSVRVDEADALILRIGNDEAATRSRLRRWRES